MDNNKIISMIDEDLTEPHSISREWVEALQICKQALKDNDKKDLEIDILIRKKETLRDEIAEQKAEIEQWKEEANKYQNLWCEAVNDIQTTKTEARKEFAKRLGEELKNCRAYDGGIRQMIDNLLKEMEEQ